MSLKISSFSMVNGDNTSKPCSKRTEDYILALESSFTYLADDPLISRKCEYIRPDLRAFNVGSYIIFFKEAEYGIAVIRILHQSMDFDRHL